MAEALKQRIIESMTWMVADIKWRADQGQNGFPKGWPQSEYSDELTDAMAVLEELTGE